MIKSISQQNCYLFSFRPDLCQDVRCKHGARCEQGVCVCPTHCPDEHQPLCATDLVTVRPIILREKQNLFRMSHEKILSFLRVKRLGNVMRKVF